MKDRLVYLGTIFLSLVPAMAATLIFIRLLIVDPCAPVYLGAIFLECEGCGKLAAHQIWSLGRFLFPFLDFYHVNSAVTGGFFYVFAIYLVTVYCLLRYTEILGKRQTTAFEGMATYRELEILERALNDFGRVRMLPPGFTIGPVVEITALFVVIKLHGEIAFPGFLIFPMVVCTTISGLFMVQGVSGKVRVASEDLLRLWRKRYGGSKYYRRNIRSMQPLTIRFASNWVDRDTVLVTQDFCVGQTVSLLMI